MIKYLKPSSAAYLTIDLTLWLLNFTWGVYEDTCGSKHFTLSHTHIVWGSKLLLISFYIFTQPICHKQNVEQGKFSSRVQLVWIQFSFSKTDCYSRTKEPSLIYYLSIARGRSLYLRVLVCSEMQTALSRIWNWVELPNKWFENQKICLLINHIYQTNEIWH